MLLGKSNCDAIIGQNILSLPKLGSIFKFKVSFSLSQERIYCTIAEQNNFTDEIKDNSSNEYSDQDIAVTSRIKCEFRDLEYNKNK